MVTQSAIDPRREEALDELIAAYLDQLEAGRTPRPEEWLDRHPEFNAELAAFFADRGQLERLAAPLRAIITRPLASVDSPGRLGDFQIGREIGRGGMGVVFEAEQISLGRRVALKVLPFAAMLGKQQLARFKNEARAAATLDHPNIVAIYSVGSEQRADIAVITLAHDAPPEAPRYPLYGGTDEFGRAAVLVGYGDAGHGASGEVAGSDATPTKRAGLNRIDAVRDDKPGVELLALDFDSGLAENNSLAIFGYESDLGFGADEVGFAVGDSGGPLFVGGAIVGVNGSVARLPVADVDAWSNSSWGEASFATRVPNHRDFILAATNSTAVFVPEPSPFVLMLSLVVVVVVVRRGGARVKMLLAAGS